MTHGLRHALFVLLAAWPPAALGAQTEYDMARTAVIAANEQELDAVVRGDAAAAASWFLDDAILLPPTGDLVRGREAIQRFWTPTPGTRILGADTRVEAFDVDGDLAYLVGSYDLESATDGRTSVVAGRFFMVWRRTPGGWRIAVDMWN